MIVKVNCRSKNLFNGQIVYFMKKPKKNKDNSYSVEIVDELAYNDPFILAQTDDTIKARASIHLSKEELEDLKAQSFGYANSKKKKTYEIHLDYGYAITCHQSQGSSWKNVAIILEERIKYTKDYYRWLYTAITRAEESVTIYVVKNKF